MARKNYRRRYYRRKGRWSVNIKDINDDQQLVHGTVNGNSVDLCLNPLQTDITVSQQYTVKNIELSVFLEIPSETTTNGAANYVEDVQHYIMYVPQGMNLTTDYNIEHPEYIMAYYYQGNSTSDTLGLGYKLKIKTRMARRLQTGDRIIYFWKARNTTTINLGVSVRGLVRWWTKAN